MRDTLDRTTSSVQLRKAPIDREEKKTPVALTNSEDRLAARSLLYVQKKKQASTPSLPLRRDRQRSPRYGHGSLAVESL